MKHYLIKYFPAVITSLVWGSTFVASKYILCQGVSSLVLMTFRFIISYVVLLIFCHEKLPIKFNKLEMMYLLLGVSGGSLYFLCEYVSLKYTSAINVGLICALVPIISTLISYLIKHFKLSKNYFIGSFIAFVGVYMVITKGNFVFDFYPLGDLIAFIAAILWSIYTVILKYIDGKINPLLVSRRLFFYALVTIAPFTMIYSDVEEWLPLLNFDVILPSLYLAVVASAACIWLWNVSINAIGLVRTNIFLYLLPVVSLLASWLFFEDEVTLPTIYGTIIIFVGIIYADYNQHK